MPKGLCFLCGKESVEGHKSHVLNEFVCRGCYREKMQPKYLCDCCGEHKPINARPKEGGKYCLKCWSIIRRGNRDLYEPCGKCGQVREVEKRTEDGGSLCPSCLHNANQEICVECNRMKPVHARTEGRGALCSRCAHNRKSETCYFCNHLRAVNYRGRQGEPVCGWCHKKHCRVYGKPVCPA